MRLMKNKGVVSLLVALLMMAGVFFIGTPSQEVMASDAATIKEDVLSVKCQVSNDKKNLRMVTTIDGVEQYKSLGFEIKFLADDDDPEKTKNHTVKTVFRKIDSKVAGVDYDFSTKVFHTESEWFATYTITGIPEAYQDNGIIIKPYVTIRETGKKIYGQSRYLTMSDIENGVVSLPVKGELTNPTVTDKEVVEKYYDGNYTHVRISADYSKIPSVSTYTITDGGKEYTAKYRYLHSQVASDTSWYTETEDGNKVIVTAGDMFGFLTLSNQSKNNGFAGKTIYLGADIDLNPGWTASATAPSKTWNPIGYWTGSPGNTSPKFAGTFDGDMHSISGIYIKKWANQLGLFGAVENATIKNFELKNSYIENANTGEKTNGETGSVVGVLDGTISNVKSSAIVVLKGTQYDGGLVGDVTTADNKMENCWFAGSVSGTGHHHGTLLGGVRNSANAFIEINNCLSTGDIDYRENAGGLVGTLWNSGQLTMSDSLFAGTFVTIDGVAVGNNGTIIGNAANGKATVTNTYAKEGTGVSTKIGNKGSNVDTGVISLADSKLFGSQAFGNMAVDFFVKDINEEGIWFAMADSTPILTSFADKTNPVDLSTAQGTRTYWFDAENPKESYTLCSPAELRGFQVLATDNNFYGIEIKLANDIDLNPEWEAGATAPTNVWTPIGRDANNKDKIIPFRGTFNGQGHTIKGVYVNSAWDRIGLFATSAADAVIKDFTLENSYIYNSSSSASAIGSIVGRLGGKLETVKSSAQVVVSGSQYAGGLVGDVHSAVGAEITNCWFAGVVAGDGQHHGGIIGGVRQITTGETMNICTITNCLSTGAIDKRQSAGGICGTVWTNGSRLVVNDSLFAGTFVDVSASSTKYIGTIAGHTNNGTVTVSNAYSSDDSGITAQIGYGNATAGNSVVILSRTGLTGVSAYRKTKLGFYIAGHNEDGKWVVSENSMPVLKSFAEAEFIDLTNIVRPDTSWYAKEPYVISTMEQLYGLAELSETTNFANKTITLSKDIVINEGDASTWGNTAPKYEWVPIQNFAGTFDGGMFSISGIYLKSNKECLGLFKQVSGTVKNVVLENSYIESTLTSGKNGIGSVVGRLAGTLQTVKSSADVVLNGSEYAGGLVGDVTTAGAKIDNCWFSGSVSGLGSHHGTLLGGLHETGATATITNCLSTGKIDYRSNAGGLVGTLWNNGKLTMADTVYAGSFVTVPVDSLSNNGTAIANAKNGSSTISKVYIKSGSGVSTKIGNAGSNSATGITDISASNLSGVAGYMNTEIGFYIPERNEAGKWVAVEDGTPVLKSFAGAEYIDLTDYIRPDTSWYAAEPYEISTMEELYGLAELSKSNDFTGKTITLTKDIVINKGNAKAWGETRPTYVWTPIQNFAGTFDGGMYSISGIYLKSNEDCLGLFKQVSGTVKNVVLENSYIESTLTSGKNGIGSVVGRLAGTLQTVKSSADVVLNGSEYAGGLVGDVTTAGAKIDNCWFSGSVSGLGSHHGTLLGGLHETGATATITNCLSTGTIEYRSNAGGLVGTLWNGGKLTMTESLFAGSFETGFEEKPSNNGTAIANAGNGVATVSAVYIKEGSGVYTKIGSKGNNVDTGVTNLADNKLNGSQSYGYMDVDFYEKDRNEDGVWFARPDSYPILTAFADTSNPVDLTTAQGTRTYWFDAENPQKSYTLYSAAELRGLQVLSETYDFNGIEIKLGKDIDLNPTWDAENPTASTCVSWEPIGSSGINGEAPKFAGTFDGDMHSISGVYIKTDKTRIGLFGHITGTVKELILKNSHLESTATANGRLGSIVGTLNGTVDTVKAENDVYVVSNGTQYVGGLVGNISQEAPGTISNSWFDGHIKGTGDHRGGILGSVLTMSGTDSPVGYIKHCLVTGTIETCNNLGGICGTAWKTQSKLTVTDSLFAGTFDEVTTSGVMGTIFGHIGNSERTEVNNVYVLKVDSEIVKRPGGSGNSSIVGTVETLTQLEPEKLYLDDARENTELSIYPQGQDTSSDGNNKQFWWYVSETHPVLASFATPVSYDKLKVATYNIKYGEANNNGLFVDHTQAVLEKIASFISSNAIDVCFLQEVNGGAQQAQSIAEKIGYTSVYREADTHLIKQSIGVAVVSKHPIIGDVVAEPIQIEGQVENRVLIKVMLDINGDNVADVAVINTHFDTNKDTTIQEGSVNKLQEILAKVEPNMPIIFAGDLNAPYSGEGNTPVIDMIHAETELTSVTKGVYHAKTHKPGAETWYQVDYVFTSNDFKHGYVVAKEEKITLDGEEKELSDHRPLIVNLYMNINK